MYEHINWFKNLKFAYWYFKVAKLGKNAKKHTKKNKLPSIHSYCHFLALSHLHIVNKYVGAFKLVQKLKICKLVI